MDFSVDQRLTITKGITKLTDLSGASYFVQRKLHGGNKLDDSEMVFYKRVIQIFPSRHNMHFYVTAYIYDVECAD